MVELARAGGSEYLITQNVKDFTLDADMRNDDLHIVTPRNSWKYGEIHMENKNTLTIRMPEALKERIETFAAQQGVSISQFATYALTKEIGELTTSHAFRNFTKGINKQALFKNIDEILANVPDREVPEWDHMPQD